MLSNTIRNQVNSTSMFSVLIQHGLRFWQSHNSCFSSHNVCILSSPYHAQFVYLNYPFPSLSVLEFGLSFTPVLHAFFSLVFLSSWCKDSRSSTWSFSSSFWSQSLKNRWGERSGSYLTIFGSFRKGFNTFFFPFIRSLLLLLLPFYSWFSSSSSSIQPSVTLPLPPWFRPLMFFSNSLFLSNAQRMYMQLVARFSSWGSGGWSGVCWLVFEERSRLLLLPWLRPPLLFPNPPLFSHMHVAGFTGFALGRKVVAAKAATWLFLGRASHSLSFAAFIPLLNAKRCLEG